MKPITLSEHSKQLINQLPSLIDDAVLREWQSLDTIDRSALIAWLKQSNQDKKSRFLLESLRASLLKDLSDSFLSDEKKDNKKEQPAPWYRKAQFGLLAFAGTALAVCEGFDGIASILGLFSSVPVYVVFAAGLAFSLLSVVVFYGFDLIEVSKNLGVKLRHSPALLDVLLEQIQQIKALRKKIDACYASATSLEDLQAMRDMIAMLEQRYQDLDDARASYKQSLHNPYLRALKISMAAATGVLFFGGGFFAGQSLAMLAVSTFFATSVAATFWPVIAVSVAIGLAAFSIYWFVERPGLENLVGRWFGLDKEKIDVLADEEEVKKQQNKLTALDKKIAARLESQTQLGTMHQKLERLERTAEVLPFRGGVEASRERHDVSVGTNRYRFLKRSHSEGDLPSWAAAFTLSNT
ncbi:hypothetical protein [Legionella nagasakiensis]|uniref:hypothetical protein n=1 Tax=Legionella nagasakiensis TaxID=535290 RepID=UPI0010554CAC|nr:hypothetical protein [Legionella nagasakiensis]